MLSQIWKNRYEVRPSLNRRIELSNEDIFFVNFSLRSTFDICGNALAKKLKENPQLKVRMLMAHPDSFHVKANEKKFSNRKVRQEMTKTLYQLKSFHDDLDPLAQKKIDVRLTYHLPMFAAKVFDHNVMLLNFYLYNGNAREYPLIEVTKTNHCEVFDNILKSLEKLFHFKSGDNETNNHKLVINGEWNQF
ncbi:conserved hypothetical protein [Candidatus Desulfarcum epimagneticum]|uniref:Uncharacterized protein n=1 Tax=uncultured Desulfobacteraceae bacterium TaxID=218296 RepID=A0A484HHR1_9BACT|nr:conserved hypothetical protein [uncultured Desulfobacteraceae bacterium]